MNSSRIGILLTTYNGMMYLSEQLDSLLAQTYSNIMIYIHDDESNDETVNIVQRYAKEFSDKITILNYEKQGSAKKNFLSMLSKVEDGYYMFCDQDDYWLPNKVEQTFQKLREIEKEENSPSLVFCDLKVVDEGLSEIAPSFWKYMSREPDKTGLEDLIRQNVAAGCTMMFNPELLTLARQYKNEDNIFMHDWWIILIAAMCGKIDYIDEALILYRQHESNTIGANKKIFPWLEEKISNVLKGRQLKESQKGILYQRKIAYELCNLPDVDIPEFLVQLSNISSKTKIFRMKFYWKNRLIDNKKNFWKIFIV